MSSDGPTSVGDGAVGRREYVRSLAALHGAVVLFGLSGVVGKVVAVSPMTIVFARAALAFLVLGSLVLWLRRRGNAAGGENREPGCRPGVLVVTGTILAVHWVTFFQSIQVSSVAVGLLSFSTFPVFVTFLEPLLLGERFLKRDLGLALGAGVGMALVTPEFRLGNAATQGALWGVVSGLTFAVVVVLNRRYVQRVSPVSLAAGQNGVAAVVLLPFLLLASGGFAGGAANPSPRDLLLLLFLGVCCTALAHLLYLWSLRRVRAHTASLVTTLEPVYGILFALPLAHEVPNVRTWVGGGVILVVAMIATRAKRSAQ